VSSNFAPDPARRSARSRAPHLRVVPTQRAPNRWLVPSLVCGAVFPAVLLLFLAIFALSRGASFSFFQGAIGLITIVPTVGALLTGGIAFARERRLMPVAERRTLYRLALAALILASLDLVATLALVLWGIVTTTVAPGGSPF
jgi:uncharacterized integral membrane protein